MDEPMSEKSLPPLLDLERDLPTTEEDVAALRRARADLSLSPEAYETFLAAFDPPSYEELLARKGPRGAPFEL